MVEVAFRQADTGKFLKKIVVFSVGFHVLMVASVFLAFWLKPEPVVEVIPIFELIKYRIRHYSLEGDKR